MNRKQSAFDNCGSDKNNTYEIAGNRAYRNNVPAAECPYPIGDGRRTDWFVGWLDARSAHRLKHIWDKYGVSYP